MHFMLAFFQHISCQLIFLFIPNGDTNDLTRRMHAVEWKINGIKIIFDDFDDIILFFCSALTSRMQQRKHQLMHFAWSWHEKSYFFSFSLHFIQNESWNVISAAVRDVKHFHIFIFPRCDRFINGFSAPSGFSLAFIVSKF